MGKTTIIGIPGLTASIPVIARVIGRVQIMREKKNYLHKSTNANVKYYTRIRRCLSPRLKQFYKDE